jgi:hypothetical protein
MITLSDACGTPAPPQVAALLQFPLVDTVLSVASAVPAFNSSNAKLKFSMYRVRLIMCGVRKIIDLYSALSESCIVPQTLATGACVMTGASRLISFTYSGSLQGSILHFLPFLPMTCRVCEVDKKRNANKQQYQDDGACAHPHPHSLLLRSLLFAVYLIFSFIRRIRLHGKTVFLT